MPTNATEPDAEVWHAHLDDTPAGARPATPRARRLQARRVLRDVVAAWLDRCADDIVIERGPCPSCGDSHGAPRVTRPSAAELEVSLSHSHGRCLVGVSRVGRIGVDIQRVTDAERAKRLAARILSPGEAVLLETPSPRLYQRRVLGSWTRKEACLKAVGIGIVVPMRDVDVGVPPTPRRTPVMLQHQTLTVSDIPIDAGWVAAVSVTAGGRPPAGEGQSCFLEAVREGPSRSSSAVEVAEGQAWQPVSNKVQS